MALNTSEMWFNGIKIAFFPKNYKKSPNSWGLRPRPSGGFRGGDGGMHPPPHQPKSNNIGRKISLYFEKLGSISGCIPPPHQSTPHDFGRKITFNFGEDLFFIYLFFWRRPDFGRKKRLNFRFRPKNQSQFRWRPGFFSFFFFFFFRDHLILGGKNVWISDFGRNISLNFGEDLFFFLWRPPDIGRKKRSNFRFRPKNHSQFMKTSEFLRFCALNPPHQNFLDPPLPRPPKPPVAGGLAPRLLVCDTFELHWLSQNVSKVRYLHFSTILV